MSTMTLDVPGTTTSASVAWRPPAREEAIRALSARGDELDDLFARARALRDAGKGRTVTYSRKAFFPVTNLCRDRCAYCTFRRDEGQEGAWTMSLDEVAAWSSRARALGCCEALLCLGDNPEAAFAGYRRWLSEAGHASTISYVAECSRVALDAGLLPHSNPGLMSPEDLALLRPVNASLGLMIESTSPRLRARGQVHWYAPDKDPEARLRVLHDAGEQRIPFTTGLLLGIGETLEERVDTILAIADLHDRFGHVQEVIVQNFRAKPEIPMATADEPDALDLQRTIAVTRLLLGPAMNVQAPPNLSEPEALEGLLAAGINDLGGISPLTPDYVNPEAPWPHLGLLARRCAELGHRLEERLPIYPEFAARPEFVAPEMRGPIAAWQARGAQASHAPEALA
ncbi:MAG: 7,8-didemethyl-8-hydroxy-5-deazariboflavin synthase CofG [Alphaproteobacteria bacterium]